MKRIFVTLLMTLNFITAIAQKQALQLWQVKISEQSATNKELWNKYQDEFRKTIIFRNDSLLHVDKEFKVIGASPIISNDDKLQFTMKTPGKIWKDTLWGSAHLQIKNQNEIWGNYKYSSGNEKGEVKLSLFRIWCCGNHNPEHCDPDLTTSCIKLH